MKMTAESGVLDALNSWAPNLGESFVALGYLGSASSTDWLTESAIQAELYQLLGADGHEVAAELWRRVLREREEFSAPVLLVILEHMRRKPMALSVNLKSLRLEFSKSLVNISHRTAGELYEGAKTSYASHEIDIAIARFRAALSEFRFAIESQLLTDATRRIATGKYATAVAMMGRWVNLSPEVAMRALTYSKESMALGNLKSETLTYRLELLVLQFDQTGDAKFLKEALQLLSDNRRIATDSDLAEAEARYRLALLSKTKSVEKNMYLNTAEEKLRRARPRGSVEEARCSILSVLIAETKAERLKIRASSVSIPRGLLSLMTTTPSSELWRVIRCVVDRLENLRKSRGSVPAAALSTQLLRAMVDGPSEHLTPDDLFRYVEITRWLSETASYNRHVRWEAGAAALSTAKRTGNLNLATVAQGEFDALAVEHPGWPLPKIGIARVKDYLASRAGTEGVAATDHWLEAATLALSSPNYARSNLGGRNEVFAVADARGFLSETFVFKRMTKEKAQHEAAMLGALRSEIAARALTNRFEVPRSLAIVEVASADERRWVHVSQRAAGRLVSELSPEKMSKALESIVEFLAIFHLVAGRAPEGKSAWRSIKDHLRMWSKTLFDEGNVDRFVQSLRELYPSALPLVRKRDGHASNWIADPAGRIVAIDLESSDFIPLAYDVVQLIEDNALIPATRDGWINRLALVDRYLSHMGISLDYSGIVAAYGWFALARALRLGTEREAGKQLKRHAREICSMLIECGDQRTQAVARDLLHALSRTEQSDKSESTPSHDHRRLSKAMAYNLRHHGPMNGVPIDGSGFASMDDLASILGADVSHILAVAEHAGEPRFEVKEGQIRALYGHSLDVSIEAGVKVGAPTSLYHGSTWLALDAIVRDGVIPMGRRMVHLTNVANEAIAVGGRKGAPIVFSIAQSRDEEPVADGIWVAENVMPDRLSIINPFADEGGVVW